LTKNKALIIGNGITRKKFDLEKAAKDHITFGCNALYRDFKPDWLTSLDGGMITEIKNSGFPDDRLYIPDVEDQYEPAYYNPNRPRENAGMLSMRLAISKGFRELYCVGMDFLIANYDTNMNNVYRGTQNYGPRTMANMQDNENRAKYFAWFTKENHDVKFIMMFPHGIWNFRAIDVRSNVTGAAIHHYYLNGD